MEQKGQDPEFEKTVDEILTDSTKCELLAETLDNQIQSDEEPFDRKGKAIINAYRNNDVDLLLIAISGWSFKTLIEMSRLEAQRQLRAEYTEEIESIIKSYGTFTITDVEAGTSPVLVSAKDSFLLAETFHEDGVIPILRDIHGNQIEQNNVLMPYKNIHLSTLSEIHGLALLWEQINEE